jgi:hypothetical protein
LGQVVLPGVFAVELRVTKGLDRDANDQEFDAAGVRVRPAGSQDDFIIVGDYFEPFDSDGSDAVFPNTTGFGATFGVDNLGIGGKMFIDDVFTNGIRDPAGIEVTELIDQAFDDEIEAFVQLANDPLGAARLVEASMGKITQAQNQIGQREFQEGTRSSDALIELNKAKQLDQEVLDAIAAGDLTTASKKLIDASTAKARAELFLEGHNPQPGPFPDGLGGFDAGDPIFADGFEPGDVSAWSVGEPINSTTTSDDNPTNPTGACTPSSTTLCLPSDGRFKAEVNWRDFSNNTGSGQVTSTGGDTGVFDLSNPNYLLTVQLLNRCSNNNHFWVFYVSTTDIEFTLTVTDTQTSQTKSYFNPLGAPAPAITDTSAFATCP